MGIIPIKLAGLKRSGLAAAGMARDGFTDMAMRIGAIGLTGLLASVAACGGGGTTSATDAPATATLSAAAAVGEKIFHDPSLSASGLQSCASCHDADHGHSPANALAALALATAIDCPLAPMLHALREYAGEPHRVQYIATLEGVDAFDDSKGTNVGATVAALDGLGAERAPAKLVVILGGDGKGQDFAPLAEPLRRHARAVITIGRDAEKIEVAIESAGISLERAASLEAAVELAFERAQGGDAVLLSPACASLDMFRNYRHRAEVFVAAVQARADSHANEAVA